MGSKWVLVLVIFMFVSLQGCLSQISGCWEEERVALLQLKHFFNDPNSLKDWVEGVQHNNSDCCRWEAVYCNESTGRVIELDLDFRRNPNLGEWLLNASLFSAFQQLEWLDLRENSIAGFVVNGGLDKLSRLSNLEMLDLGVNMFNNDILPSLDVFPSLKKLYLNNNRLKGTVDLQGLHFHLHNLYLNDNEIDKVVFTKGLDKLSRLSNLEFLDLGGNMFNNDILSSLRALSSINYLYLNRNRLNGTIDLQGLDSCNNLQVLMFSSNEIEKVVFHKGPGALSSLKTLYLDSNKLNGIIDFQGLDNLEYLDLRGNMLNSSMLSSIGALSSLKSLYLNDKGLRGTVDIAEFYSLSNLEFLDMSNNEIDKFIFPKDGTSLKGLTELYLVNISIRDGSSLLRLLGSFSSLKTLDLRFNNFSETTTTPDLPYLRNLTSLHMDDTNLGINFLQLFGMLTSLEVLSLSNCELQETLSRQDGGMLAEFLYHQHNLQVVDLSHNNLTGEFPNWLLENNTELYYLDIANNLLGGRFQLPIHSHMNLTTLDISKNFFHEDIPKEIGGYLPSIKTLNLSSNDFEGSIPFSIGDMNLLESLDLSFNQLFGKIPKHLAEGCTSLQLLALSNNSLQGQIFSSNFSLTKLWILQLDGNKFTGKIPDSLSNASYLSGLYLSANNLSGRIPSWLGNLSSLTDIIMPNNHLEGPIPLEFCQLKYLESLNLAENNISGSLPFCFSPPLITQVHLSKNRLQGQLKDAFYLSSSLVTLDLGYNQLQGSIPTWIGRISDLTYLILSNNNLEGKVPTQLCQLKRLSLVDVSHNNLSGHIPHCLDVTSLHDNSDIVEAPTFLYRRDRPLQQLVEVQTRKGEAVEFTTKTISYSYQGKVLTYMSGIDLSSNRLTGSIPQEIGNLTRIHTLNLSHNNLTGPIPWTFSKLKQIESLDLSYNNLNGKIPHQLVELYCLSSFSVAHNNLSGKTPERIAQFNTFNENSYEGNPLLCGLPLRESCDTTRSPPTLPKVSTDNEEGSDFIDMDIFYISFTVCYIIMFLGVVVVLYINPYGQRSRFYLIERWMTSCYYCVADCLLQRYRH